MLFLIVTARRECMDDVGLPFIIGCLGVVQEDLLASEQKEKQTGKSSKQLCLGMTISLKSWPGLRSVDVY